LNNAFLTYNPSLGRFLSADPLLEAFPNQSPYSYSFNNPLSYRDPSGLAPEKEKGGKNQIQMKKFTFIELIKKTRRKMKFTSKFTAVVNCFTTSKKSIPAFSQGL